jgi:hypothetical protein
MSEDCDLHSLQAKHLITLQPEQMLDFIMELVAKARRQKGLPGTEAYFTPPLLDLMKVNDAVLTFEQSFTRYLGKTMERAQRRYERIMRSVEGRWVPPVLDAEIRGIIAGIPSTTSFSSHIGVLNSGWAAAEQLRGEYDMKLGMARKGLWLSHVFDLAGWEGNDVLVMRGGFNDRRINIFLDPDEQLSGKRVLLLDNDLMTGQSASNLAKHVMMDCKAKEVGVLTVYDHCDLTQEEFEIGKSMLDPKRVLGRGKVRNIETHGLSAAEGGELETVVMSLPTDLPHVTKMHNLRQFKPEFRAFDEVRKRLAR